MGKTLDGGQRSISTDGPYLSTVVGQWLALATQGYPATRLRRNSRLPGKLNWTAHPSLGAHPFLGGSYLWLHKGPPKAHFTPARGLRGLAETYSLLSPHGLPLPFPIWTPMVYGCLL